jgi:endonuclease YncB( thermonuclease family)
MRGIEGRRAAVLARLLGLGLIAAVQGGVPSTTRAAEIVSYAIVQEDATLKVRGRTVRLHGVYIPESGRICQRNLRPAVCKTRAANALELRIQGFVRCLPTAEHRDRSISAVCYVDGHGTLDPPVDLGAYLIERGLAVAGPNAPFEYVTLERIARANDRGVWGFQADSFNRRRNPR